LGIKTRTAFRFHLIFLADCIRGLGLHINPSFHKLYREKIRICEVQIDL